MAINFSTRQLTLNRQALTATGSLLYLNGLLIGSGTYASLAALAETGSNLYNLLVNESGVFVNQIASTGSQAWNAANNNGINLSGNLTLTGQTLDTKTNTLSGFVGQVSGGLETRITATGNAAINHANGIGVNLSGNLTTTGQTLYSLIVNDSGRSEGIYVHRTGAELISGAKTLVDTTQFLANLRFTNVQQSTSFTFAAGTYRYIWSGAANCTGTLPAASATSGIEFMVKNLSPTGSLVISGLIDYSQNYSLTPQQGITLWSDNTSWLLV